MLNLDLAAVYWNSQYAAQRGDNANERSHYLAEKTQNKQTHQIQSTAE